MRTKWLLVPAFIAVLALSTFSRAQTAPPPSGPYIETFEVRLHNIDVVVTDRTGRHVHGLGKDDFELTENGVRQTVTNFSVYGESSGTTTISSPSSATAPGAAIDTAPPARRWFVFFIDELAIHSMTRDKLLKSATDLVRKSMKPGDQAMVVTPAASPVIALPFTDDRNVVIAKLESVIGASFGLQGNSQAVQERRYLERSLRTASGMPEAHHIMRTYARMVNRRVEQRLGQLRSVVATLGELPGRKVLMLVIDSLPAQPGIEAFRRQPRASTAGGNTQNDDQPFNPIGRDIDTTRLAKNHWVDQRPAIDDLARKASSNGVTIYSLQPEYGLEMALSGGGADMRGMGTSQLDSQFMNDAVSSTESTMASLTELTGGKWFRGDGPVDDVFEQVASDLDAYYSLGYPAPEGAADVPRAISVRVKNRPELRVRFRKEVVKKSVSQEMTDQVVAHLVVPRQNNELGITIASTPPVIDADTRVVDVVVRVPMERMTFLPDGEAGYKARFSVHYAVSGQTADFVAGENRQQTVAVAPADMPRIAGKTWKYSTRLRLPMTEMKVAFGVLDINSRLTGFETLKVPAAPNKAKR
jgi:VWFA-related protein